MFTFQAVVPNEMSGNADYMLLDKSAPNSGSTYLPAQADSRPNSALITKPKLPPRSFSPPLPEKDCPAIPPRDKVSSSFSAVRADSPQKPLNQKFSSSSTSEHARMAKVFSRRLPPAYPFLPLMSFPATKA